MALPHPEDPVIVAVDFTAGLLRICIAEIGGRRWPVEAWPLPQLSDEQAWSWEIGGRVAETFAREGGRRSALAIAVAAPGSVDPVGGRILHSEGEEAWDGLAVVDALRRHIDVPVAAVSRRVAALQAEAPRVAPEATDVLYVSLREPPGAAILAGGRVLTGASHQAGALPAMPALDPDATPEQGTLETITGLLADAAALLDPEVVILDADPAHLGVVGPLLQRVIDEVSPGPRVAPAPLGEEAPLLGALRVAAILAYEGERDA